MLGYGMILITHSKTRIEKLDDDNTIEILSPNIPDRAQDVVNALVDIIGCIKVTPQEDGTAKRTLVTRATPNIVAGSRLKYLPPEIPFGYDELVAAMSDAIDMEEQSGAKVVEKTEKQEIIKKRPFNETVEEARILWTKLVEKDADNAEKIMKVVERIFGRQMKLSEIPEEQQDLFELLIEEMRSL